MEFLDHIPYWSTFIFPLLIILGKILLIVVPLMLSVAYFTLAERKVIGSMQLRQGPNTVGFYGLLQPFADGLKLLCKETIIPFSANPILFLLAPIITFTLALVAWAVVPFDIGLVLSDINVGLMFLFAVSSLGVYGIIIAGWASNSKYAFLGALRSAAQMISYEISIGLIIVSILLCVGSLNVTDIVLAQKKVWFLIPHFPMYIMFVICTLAETNRAPFDLPEAEAELVAGYNVEYSSMAFALFFLGEYANIILMATLTTILFLGGWLPPVNVAPFTAVPGPIWMFLKIAFSCFVFLWARATLPRYRYDQLMRLGWKIFLPLSFVWVVFTAFFLKFFNLLPG